MTLGVRMLKDLIVEQLKPPNESAIQTAASHLKDAFELGNLSLPNKCEISLPEKIKVGPLHLDFHTSNQLTRNS